jgi:hypothetical protein
MTCEGEKGYACGVLVVMGQFYQMSRRLQLRFRNYQQQG